MSVATATPTPVRLPVMPATRAGCAEVPRPCPHAGCKWHLARERRRPALPGAPSCTLDVADQDGASLQEVGDALGITRERVRQLTVRALQRLGSKLAYRGLIDRQRAEQLRDRVRELLVETRLGGGAPRVSPE